MQGSEGAGDVGGLGVVGYSLADPILDVAHHCFAGSVEQATRACRGRFPGAIPGQAGFRARGCSILGRRGGEGLRFRVCEEQGLGFGV